MRHLSSHTIIPEYVPRSTSHDGRFGRIFGKLPPWIPPGTDDKNRIETIDAFVKNSMSLPQPEPEPGNANIPAGYTYFGQFVDHDITFDPTSSLIRQNDPEGLQNFRSPRLDLDSIYGRGPDDQPYLYQQDAVDSADNPIKGLLLTGTGINGKEFDLPRIRPEQAVVDAAVAGGEDVPAVALIGDPRNDENIIVSQFQLTFLRLHNRLLRKLTEQDLAAGSLRTAGERFHEAQRIVRWFYQYVVWNDWVKRLVPHDIWEMALKLSSNGTGLELGLKDVYNWRVNPFIPVEFSVAAYRLGHSLIRAGYQLSFPRQQPLNHPDGPVGPHHELPIFDPTITGKPDLHGGRLLPDKHTIEWDWYFSMGAPKPPFPQLSNFLDIKISSSVANIPGSNRPLATLNILRGWRFGLPSGTDVAHAMGFAPIALDDEMENSLWVYILKEAEKFAEKGEPKGSRLGPVGGTIVAAVFAGLLKGDSLSYAEQFPLWRPDQEPLLQGLGRRPVVTGDTDRDVWDLRDLLAIANMPINPDQVEQVIAGQEPT
jgi:hypothetical protein